MNSNKTESVTCLMLHLVSRISSLSGTGVSSFSLNILRSSFKLPQLLRRLQMKVGIGSEGVESI